MPTDPTIRTLVLPVNGNPFWADDPDEDGNMLPEDWNPDTDTLDEDDDTEEEAPSEPWEDDLFPEDMDYDFPDDTDPAGEEWPAEEDYATSKEYDTFLADLVSDLLRAKEAPPARPYTVDRGTDGLTIIDFPAGPRDYILGLVMRGANEGFEIKVKSFTLWQGVGGLEKIGWDSHPDFEQDNLLFVSPKDVMAVAWRYAE